MPKLGYVPKSLLLRARSKKRKWKKVRNRAELRRTRRKQLLGGFLVLAMIAPTQSTYKPNIKMMYVCTGNTCRSAGLSILAQNTYGIDITTCGSNVRMPGSEMTPALQNVFGNRNIVKKHRSSACNPCADVFKYSKQGKKVMYAVVAESNRQQLFKMASKCNVFIKVSLLSEITSACKPLEEDPWNHSKEAICPRGNCTEEQLQKEKAVYNALPGKVARCLHGIKQKLGTL